MTRIVPLLLIVLIGSMWLAPTVAPMLSILLMLFSMGMAVSAIFRKHRGSESAGAEVAKEVLILVGTLALIIVLGGLSGLLINHYARPYLGTFAGFLLAILASLSVGYLVKKSIGKIIG